MNCRLSYTCTGRADRGSKHGRASFGGNKRRGLHATSCRFNGSQRFGRLCTHRLKRLNRQILQTNCRASTKEKRHNQQTALFHLDPSPSSPKRSVNPMKACKYERKGRTTALLLGRRRLFLCRFRNWRSLSNSCVFHFLQIFQIFDDRCCGCSDFWLQGGRGRLANR